MKSKNALTERFFSRGALVAHSGGPRRVGPAKKLAIALGLMLATALGGPATANAQSPVQWPPPPGVVWDPSDAAGNYVRGVLNEVGAQILGAGAAGAGAVAGQVMGGQGHDDYPPEELGGHEEESGGYRGSDRGGAYGRPGRDTGDHDRGPSRSNPAADEEDAMFGRHGRAPGRVNGFEVNEDGIGRRAQDLYNHGVGGAPRPEIPAIEGEDSGYEAPRRNTAPAKPFSLLEDSFVEWDFPMAQRTAAILKADPLIAQASRNWSRMDSAARQKAASHVVEVHCKAYGVPKPATVGFREEPEAGHVRDAYYTPDSIAINVGIRARGAESFAAAMDMALRESTKLVQKMWMDDLKAGKIPQTARGYNQIVDFANGDYGGRVEHAARFARWVTRQALAGVPGTPASHFAAAARRAPSRETAAYSAPQRSQPVREQQVRSKPVGKIDWDTASRLK